MGYRHIPRNYAAAINEWYQEYFNTYLNYHRPCAYPTRITNKKGKEVFVYRQEDYMTPYEKLKSLENAKQYLKEGVTFETLDEVAYALSDTDFAKGMQEAKRSLFENFKGIN